MKSWSSSPIWGPLSLVPLPLPRTKPVHQPIIAVSWSLDDPIPPYFPNNISPTYSSPRTQSSGSGSTSPFALTEMEDKTEKDVLDLLSDQKHPESCVWAVPRPRRPVPTTNLSYARAVALPCPATLCRPMVPTVPAPKRIVDCSGSHRPRQTTEKRPPIRVPTQIRLKPEDLSGGSTRALPGGSASTRALSGAPGPGALLSSERQIGLVCDQGMECVQTGCSRLHGSMCRLQQKQWACSQDVRPSQSVCFVNLYWNACGFRDSCKFVHFDSIEPLSETQEADLWNLFQEQKQSRSKKR